MSEWKSPRKIEQEITEYRRQRFETYMQAVDNGTIEQALAIAALRDEIEYQAELTVGESV